MYYWRKQPGKVNREVKEPKARSCLSCSRKSKTPFVVRAQWRRGSWKKTRSELSGPSHSGPVANGEVFPLHSELEEKHWRILSRFEAQSNCSFFFFCLLSVVLLGSHQWHMEVPRLGGLIRAVAAALHQSHSNARSEPHLGPTPQLMAMPDP